MKNSLAPSVVTHRDRKGCKFMDIVAAAYDKARLSEDEAQRVNDTPGLPGLIAKFIAENRSVNKFKDEETPSSYGYLSGYKPRGRGIVEQTNRLRELFSGIGYANQDLLTQIEGGKIELPENAEGWFAIPNWIKNPRLFGSSYNEAVQKVLDLLKQTRDGAFHNYREGQLGAKNLRQSEKSEEVWKKLSEEQGNPDILIVAGQFGIHHRGRSVRRAREVMNSSEFGLGAFAIGIMLLTHPERLQDVDDLWIDCAGDKFSPDAGGRFASAPGFGFRDGRLRFCASDVGDVGSSYGSASAFLPQ